MKHKLHANFITANILQNIKEMYHQSQHNGPLPRTTCVSQYQKKTLIYSLFILIVTVQYL